MMRMWIDRYISSENLEQMASTWTLTPTSTDMATAIRLCSMFGVGEDDNLETVHQKVKAGLEQLVLDLNRCYNIQSKAPVRFMSTLSIWVPYEEVYAIMNGVDYSHKVSIRVEVDITNLMFVDLDLIGR